MNRKYSKEGKMMKNFGTIDDEIIRLKQCAEEIYNNEEEDISKDRLIEYICKYDLHDNIVDKDEIIHLFIDKINYTIAIIEKDIDIQIEQANMMMNKRARMRNNTCYSDHQEKITDLLLTNSNYKQSMKYILDALDEYYMNNKIINIFEKLSKHIDKECIKYNYSDYKDINDKNIMNISDMKRLRKIIFNDLKRLNNYIKQQGLEKDMINMMNEINKGAMIGPMLDEINKKLS